MGNKSKPFTDIAWGVSEEEYRADDAYSYSLLAKFNREGYKNIDQLFDKVDSVYLTFGSMVDTLLTGTKEEFDNMFLITSIPSLSDSISKIVDSLFIEASDRYSNIKDIPDAKILDTVNFFNYQSNWRDQTRINKIKEEGEDYYNLLFVSQGKKIVSTEDYEAALQCAEVLKTDSMTAKYFNESNPFENIQSFNQLKFKGTYENIDLRCMADRIIVNHDTKTVTPIDIKTSSSREDEFYKSFINWNYWIQAQLYWYIIRQAMDQDDFYKEYKLENYLFIVISRHTLTPLVWEYRDTQATVDLEYLDGKYKCKNWRNIVKELDYYLKERPKYMIGITEINDIVYWLKHGNK